MDLDKLKVYRDGQELLSETLSVLSRLPRGTGWLADQARRAASSIPLNIAEGWGYPANGNRRRAFDVAIGSAHEPAACFEVAYRMGSISKDKFHRLWDQADQITHMLGAMCKGLR